MFQTKRTKSSENADRWQKRNTLVIQGSKRCYFGEGKYQRYDRSLSISQSIEGLESEGCNEIRLETLKNITQSRTCWDNAYW